MYKKATSDQFEFEDFYLPFGGNLRSNNRWVRLAKIVPWQGAEALYRDKFSRGMGSPAKPLRVALGALIIKERCGFTDEETTQQIRENPYLQYFIGYGEFSDAPPFDPSMMVHFRKRLSLDFLNQVNEMIVEAGRDDKKDDDGGSGGAGKPNEGKLIVDATCAPADIRYPTDLSLLNEAREKLENIIDTMHAPNVGTAKKPRTYRQKARRDFLRAIKAKFKKAKTVRKAVGKQLRYVRRNLRYIAEFAKAGGLDRLTKTQYRNLLVISELYRQQHSMFMNKTHRIDGRIVSITQPHVRPIVRGKAGVPVEFGAKLSLSLVNGYARIDHFSWDNYNEGALLVDRIERYFERNGCYPESVHADKIYRNRDNRKYCKERNIRMSGPALGRPVKNSHEKKSQRIQREQDLRERIAVEGKFGEGKRRYGLGRIMAKLSDTSEAVVGINAIAMNLEKRLRVLFTKICRALSAAIASTICNYRIDYA